jgi:hypothetical protein
MDTPRLLVAGRSLCAEIVSLAGTPATLGAATPGAASLSWRLEVLEKELLGAATSGGILPRLVALEVAWLGEAQAGAVWVRFAALESELGMPSSASDAALAPPTAPPLAPLYKSLLDAIPNRELCLNADGHDTYDIVAWWAQAIVKLPALKKVFIIVTTHSPSSCAPERVFSVLNRTFGPQRSSTRQDATELSTMHQFKKL